MVRPLIPHPRRERLNKRRKTVLGHHNRAEIAQKRVNAVVDLGVNMIGSARKHHNRLVVPLGNRAEFRTLDPYRRQVAVVSGVSGANGLRDLPLAEVGEVRPHDRRDAPRELLRVGEGDEFVNEIGFRKLRNVQLQNLRVVSDNRAVVVVHA